MLACLPLIVAITEKIMGHADPKIRTAAPRTGKVTRTHVIDAGETTVTRCLVNATATRRAIRAILRDMPKGAQARESIRAKIQAVRRRG